MYRKTRALAPALALMLLLAAGCAAVTGGRVNPVEQAGLQDTIAVEVLEFDPSITEGPPYAERLTLTDAQGVAQLVDALDTGLQQGLKVQCIPEYTLRFHLQDGTLQEFGYSCNQVAFLRGEQDFWREQDYRPPRAFEDLLREQLARLTPELAGSQWTLASISGNPLLADTEIGLYFEDAKLGGKMTCNGYGGGPDSGAYNAEGGTLSVPVLAVTVQACTTPEGVMEQEAAYIETLQRAAGYRVIGDRLVILDAGGATTLVFAK